MDTSAGTIALSSTDRSRRCLEGWNDAADAASAAARYPAPLGCAHVRDHRRGRVSLTLRHPPEVRLTDGWAGRLVASIDVSFARVPGGDHDVVFVSGLSAVRWRTFCDEVMGVPACWESSWHHLGALLADVSHARPCAYGTAADPDLVKRPASSTRRWGGSRHSGVIHDAATGLTFNPHRCGGSTALRCGDPFAKGDAGPRQRATRMLSMSVVTASSNRSRSTTSARSVRSSSLTTTWPHTSAASRGTRLRRWYPPLELQSGDALAAELESSSRTSAATSRADRAFGFRTALSSLSARDRP